MEYLSHHPLYNLHDQLKHRCTSPKSPHWPEYGGVGIKLHGPWYDFETFLAEVGDRPTLQHSLDRYPNNQGNYEPGNVRWATPDEQARNRKSNVNLTYRGRTQCALDWANELGVSYGRTLRRKRAGWSDEANLTSASRPAGRPRKPLK